MSTIEKLGYSKNSPFKSRKSILINSNNITMKNTNIPLMLYPDADPPIAANPNSGNYFFPNSSKVLEVPIKELPKYQQGGCFDTSGKRIPCPQNVKEGTKIFNNKKEYEKAARKYNDSASLYNDFVRKNDYFIKNTKDLKTWEDTEASIPGAGIQPIMAKGIYYPENSVDIDGDGVMDYGYSNKQGIVKLPEGFNKKLFGENPEETSLYVYKRPSQPVYFQNAPPQKSPKKEEKKRLVMKMVKRPSQVPSYEEFVKGVNPDYLAPNYDLKTAYKELPFEIMEKWRKTPEKNHLPDTYKLPNHPTFSVESIYHKEGDNAGRWEKDVFIPKESAPHIPQQGTPVYYSNGHYIGNIYKGEFTPTKDTMGMSIETINLIKDKEALNKYLNTKFGKYYKPTFKYGGFVSKYQLGGEKKTLISSILEEASKEAALAKIDPIPRVDPLPFTEIKAAKEVPYFNPVEKSPNYKWGIPGNPSFIPKKQTSEKDTFPKVKAIDILNFANIIGRVASKNHADNLEDIYTAQNIANPLKDTPISDLSNANYFTKGTFMAQLGGEYEDDDADFWREYTEKSSIPQDISVEEPEEFDVATADMESLMEKYNESPESMTSEELYYIINNLRNPDSTPISEEAELNMILGGDDEWGDDYLTESYAGDSPVIGNFNQFSKKTLTGDSVVAFGNNPGAIVWTKEMADKFGATKGKSQKTQGSKVYKGNPSYYAKFPDIAKGFDAMHYLLTLPVYQKLSVKDALTKWIGDEGYSTTVAKKFGNKTMSALSSEELKNLIFNISKHEDRQAYNQIISMSNTK